MRLAMQYDAGRTLHNEVSQCGFDAARARPAARHSAYCVHRPYCSTPTSIDATQPLCKALWRNLSLRGAPFDSALYPSVATSYRIVEHHYTATLPISHPPLRNVHPWQYRPHPSSTVLTRGWSLPLRRNACRPVS